MPAPILVVGASVGGMAFVERYRARGGEESIVLVGAEDALPYDRPPLSKQALFDADWDAGSAALKPPEWYRDNDVELSLGRSATALDASSKTVTLAGGARLRASQVVVATGSRVRRLAFLNEHPGVYYLRDLVDAMALRAALRADAGNLVVLGAGFIGLEVAAAARLLGWEVTVLEREKEPLSRVLGGTAGLLCVGGLANDGIDIRCGCAVDGAIPPADLVVVGVGAQPNVEWLAGSGLTVDDGVVCDVSGRTSAPGVWAVGDVARWRNVVTARHDRVEQWQAARDHGAIVAEAMLDSAAPGWVTPPYFWSDLGKRKVQSIGVCRGDVEPDVFIDGHRVLMLFGESRLDGILTVSFPRAIAFGRRLLMRGVGMAEAREWAETFVHGNPS